MANTELTPERSVELSMRLVGQAEQLARLLLELPVPVRERTLEQFVASVRNLMRTIELLQRARKAAW